MRTAPTRKRFLVETALAVVSAALLLLTLLWKEWIEILFGVDPDGGSGALEWAIVAAMFAITVAFGALARRDRPRSQEVLEET
jgi:hypothetical protein